MKTTLDPELDLPQLRQGAVIDLSRPILNGWLRSFYTVKLYLNLNRQISNLLVRSITLCNCVVSLQGILVPLDPLLLILSLLHQIVSIYLSLLILFSLSLSLSLSRSSL